jgi:hypothetical protein
MVVIMALSMNYPFKIVHDAIQAGKSTIEDVCAYIEEQSEIAKVS